MKRPTIYTMIAAIFAAMMTVSAVPSGASGGDDIWKLAMQSGGQPIFSWKMAVHGGGQPISSWNLAVHGDGQPIFTWNLAMQGDGQPIFTCGMAVYGCGQPISFRGRPPVPPESSKNHPA